jgi:hypothetical protein
MTGVVTLGGELAFEDGLEGVGSFCNVSISINGQFEIAEENGSGAVTGCLSPRVPDGYIVIDSASACALNGGAGYPWDRWTAISIQYHGHQLWMFENPYVARCMEEILDSGYYYDCNSTLHAQWFSWPGVKL